MFSRVPNSILPQTGPPHVLALTPMRSCSISSQIEPFHHQESYLTIRMMNCRPLLLQQSHFDLKAFIALKLMHSDTFPLNFKPNPTIWSPGHLFYHLDNKPSFSFAPAMSFQPEMAPIHFQSPCIENNAICVLRWSPPPPYPSRSSQNLPRANGSCKTARCGLSDLKM